ncbi:hypothetical protein AB6J89_004698 [Salmonella enterica]|jgi:hypothetical protein
MPKKITVDTTAVKKPEGNGLRSQLARMPVNGVISLEERAVPENGESAIDAALRMSQALRSRHSRSVTDARKKTGQKYTISSSRKWDKDAFVCTLEIIRIA